MRAHVSKKYFNGALIEDTLNFNGLQFFDTILQSVNVNLRK